MNKIYSNLILLAIILQLSGTFSGTQGVLAQEINLRPLFEKYGLTIRDQGGRGTCSVFAIVGLMEFEYAHRLNTKVELSVEFLNWASNRITGEAGDGSFFSDALTALKKYGICRDSLFPYYICNYNSLVEPSAAALTDGRLRRQASVHWIKEWNPDKGMTEDQVQQVKAQIRTGHPVAIGFLWPKNEGQYRKTVDGIMTVPPREGVFDGHSVIITGYRDDPALPGGGCFMFRNSHGSGYEDDGYGEMPYEYARKYANDGVFLEVGKFTRLTDTINLSELDTSKMERGEGATQKAISRWLITLDGQAVTLKARAVLTGIGGEGFAAEFFLVGDRKVIWRSGIMRTGDDPLPVKVKLAGIRKLGLLVMNAGAKEAAAKADWADGTITYAGNMPFASDNGVYREEEVILTPQPPEKPRINAPKITGVHPGSPFLYRIPATGARPMRFSVRHLPEGLVVDGETGIISGRINREGSFKTFLIAENSKGRDSLEFTIEAGPTLALTPPMGWNSWYIYYSRVSDSIMRRAADKMIESGMADFGYQYVNIDDCWAIRLNSDDPVIGGSLRNPDGTLRSNGRFPDMKALTDYIHAKGLRAGIYGTPGQKTCAGYTGSYGYEALDIKTWADWGFDFLKYDWCSYGRLIPERTTEACMKPYQLIWNELSGIKRDIIINLCQYGMADVWKWGGSVGNSWRTTGDLGILEGSSMPPFYYIGLANSEHWEYARPGAWNDPDYILIGWFRNALKEEQFEKTGLTPDEQYAYMTMWAMMAAPLIYSSEMSLLDPFTLNILCNNEVIAVNQDYPGKQARIIRKTADELILLKELADGSKAIALFQVTGDANTSNPDLVDEEAAGMNGVIKPISDPAGFFTWENQPPPTTIRVSAKEMGLEDTFRVRDLWRQNDIGEFSGYLAAEVPYHGVSFFRVWN
jgi:alpha-galactosidase